jgi:Raf kinase inhibitor-like YbhB/YbcL family protein
MAEIMRRNAMRINVCVIAILLGASVWVHGEEKEATMAQFTLSSPSFLNNHPMPAKFSCEGNDASPALKWEGAPSGTKGFALCCYDPDAPGGTWVHWVIYAIPATVTDLAENVAKTETLDRLGGSKQGMNDFGKVGYGGPCPPRGHGEHHYHFHLYALDAELNLAPRLTRIQLYAAMKGHILAEAELVGTYQRD